MRQNIALYIDGVKADCDSSTLILMNYTREELESPSVVRNSYSQNVELPGTPVNNKIFSHYFRMDYSTGGSNFSAVVRVPFLLQSDSGEVLEHGYLRLISVAYKGRDIHSYSVQLYGGLGGFFYGLTYRPDGSKQTLGDLAYGTTGGRVIPSQTQFGISAAAVKEAWDRLDESGYEIEDEYDILNFAPAYNGLPKCKFDANKGVYKEGQTYPDMVANLYTSKQVEGVNYHPMYEADGYALIELENEHTEWETQDLRAYLMRPVIRVQAILEALTDSFNTPGYTFKLNGQQLFTEEYSQYASTWITLKMFDRDRLDPMVCTMDEVIGETDTPADYLIGFAKLFGCVFHYDPSTGVVELMTRDQFYDTGEAVIDLTGRIDRSREMSVVPYPFEHKYYEFSLETEGEFAEQYEQKYKKVYGSMVVDTGYDFDKETEKFFQDVPYKGAADVVESNRNFFVSPWAVDPEYGDVRNYSLKFAFTEKVSWRLYHLVATDSYDTIDCEPLNRAFNPMPYAPGYADFMPKVQLHSDDNDAIDGSNVLLFYRGKVDVPHTEASGHDTGTAVFRLTNDSTATLRANEGVPCWNFTPGDGIALYELPSFRRWDFILGGQVEKMFDFGIPREVKTPEVPGQYAQTMYDDWWKVYIEDRYHKDSRVMRCFCNLRGLQVGQGLLRRFFYYEGALWSLNKIINHSITTLDTTECEFVRVQDKAHYTSGQYMI